mmetsp:Transcript_1041/g.1480  ORF Transcript_1041/g.1480 Transcript_1041/m.1480 type:complete len:273 (-) Transcript_1041:379-1197(-)
MVAGRVAVVTGGNKGIGFHAALQLARSGLFASVIIGCRDATRGKVAVSDILAQGPTANVCYLPLNVGDSRSHSSFAQAIEEQFGRLDVLVNNAAIAFKNADPTPHEEQAKPTLDINFRGTVDLIETLLPMLRKGEDPRVVNVASMSGRLAQIKSSALREKISSSSLTLQELRDLVDQYEQDVVNGSYEQKGWGYSNYGMSKLALIAATKVLARDEDPLVKVNCCCPGYCDTDMTSHKGPRPPSEGAKNPVLLATMKECPTGEYYENLEVARW